MQKSIVLLGEYAPSFVPHAATEAAIRHSHAALGIDMSIGWVSTADVDRSLFERMSGLWVVPGSPYKSLPNTLDAIRYARENRIPCFGTCGGFQHMVLEYARNVLGYTDAQHAEYDPYSSRLFIDRLNCSLVGREFLVRFAAGSKVAESYGTASAREAYYCDFGVNPDCVDELEHGPLRVSGVDENSEIRAIEFPDHPFFVGTLYVPQVRSTFARPHPLVTAFLRSASVGKC